ncbi:MAG: Ig-like domain-containing protein [Deltaproteobacteria bacterium]
MALDLCLPTSTDANDPARLQEGACLLVRPPTPPYVFPTNFPGEVFYHRVVTAPVATGPSTRATLVLALEASFGAGTPAAGQQMVFTRIRLFAGVPFDGTYTVTHPYGTETFPDVKAGSAARDIIFTEDVGLAPGNFTDALVSRVGPFLQHSDEGPGGAPAAALILPFAGTAPNTSAIPGVSRSFLGDGATPRWITGSPFGTNYFEMCGPFDGPGFPDRCIRQDLFTVTGMLHEGALGSPLSVQRSTYNRNDAGSHVDVMARASAGPGQLAPLLSVGGHNVPPVKLDGPNVLGDWYAQGIPVPAGAIPSTVTVTNSSDVIPTSIVARVTDEVNISSATLVAGTLTVVATSSDKGVTNGDAPAKLSLAGFPAATRVSTANGADPAEVRFTATGVTIPPANVRVSSDAGGEAFAELAIGNAAASYPDGVPYAADDQANAFQNEGAANPIFILRNDVCGGAALGGTITIVSNPTLGVASVGSVPNLPNPPERVIFYRAGTSTGTDTFKYTVANGVGRSNVGTVTVTILPDPLGPIPTANPDPIVGSTINVTAGQAVTVNVLANDSGNGGVLDPASVVVSAAPVRGTTTVNLATGAITYQSTATAGTITFQYTVKNTAATGGRLSAPATVTVNVVTAEALTMRTPGSCSLPNRWRLQGTSSVSANNIVTIYDGGSPTKLDGTANPIIGTVPVINGNWQFQGTNYACRATVSIRSSLGTTLTNLPVQVK